MHAWVATCGFLLDRNSNDDPHDGYRSESVDTPPLFAVLRIDVSSSSSSGSRSGSGSNSKQQAAAACLELDM